MILQDRRWSNALGSARLHPLTDEADNLSILDLREVLVELAYGPEVDWCQHADDVIAAAADLREPTERGHGHGDDQLVRLLRLIVSSAAIIVEPVAIPSSVAMTDRPLTVTGGRTLRKSFLRRSISTS